MKLYAAFEPTGGGGWGDCFPALFFTEWLYENADEGSLEIAMFDLGAQAWGKNNWRLRDHINKPAWIAEWLNGPPTLSGKNDINLVLATHYNHPQRNISEIRAKLGMETLSIQADRFDPHYGGYLPPAIYKGSSDLGILRLHNDAWWATLVDKLGWRPTLPELKEPPTLPEEPFVAIQFRRNEVSHEHKPGRNALEGDSHDRWAHNFIGNFDGPIVLLSDQLEDTRKGVIDASQLSLWQKIYVAAKAEAFYGAHSGFGGICASYAKKAFVINPSVEGSSRNPPLVLFDNVKCLVECDTYTARGPYVDQASAYAWVAPCS